MRNDKNLDNIIDSKEDLMKLNMMFKLFSNAFQLHLNETIKR